MECENCGSSYPGKLVKVNNIIDQLCIECGRHIKVDTSKWDTYFHTICQSVASKSPCLSRHIGAILVRDHSIVSTGYNGPSRGVPHCGHDRVMKDNTLTDAYQDIYGGQDIPLLRFRLECPRKILGYLSGTHMELCPAQHAETNAISNAARLGVSVLGTTLYMNSVIPCKGCYGALINAGIVEIVIDEITVFDKHTQYLIDNSNIKIRSFEL